MATWAEIEQAVPDLADRVRRVFAAGTNKTIATLRRDGAPRISATELEIGAGPVADAGRSGEVTLGMMGGSTKLLDVRRDPRVAVHSPTVEPPADDAAAWPGDAKLAGTVVEIAPPAEDAQPGAAYFRLDVTELVLTYLGTPADHLVIESWHEGRGRLRRTRR